LLYELDCVSRSTELQREGITNFCFSQALRAIPELQPALNSFTSAPGVAGGLTAEMRKLYTNMNQTTEKFMPAVFLERLRQFAPQFAEFRPGQGYAQQGERTPSVNKPKASLISSLDAEECLGAIFQSLRDSHVAVPATSGSIPFEKYVMGEMTKE
jgi:ubiquitin carboxyl-terminal hydrolase 14